MKRFVRRGPSGEGGGYSRCVGNRMETGEVRGKRREKEREKEIESKRNDSFSWKMDPAKSTSESQQRK